MRKILFVLGLAVLLSACDNSKSKVSRYYKATTWNRNCPRLPLYEPLAIYKDLSTPPEWFMSFDDLLSGKKNEIDYHSIGANIISINDIGADRGVVYGCIKESELIETGAEFGNYAFINSKGGFSFPLKNRPSRENEQALVLIDSTKRSFLVPERWYLINTKDTTYKFFFDKKNYQAELKELNVSSQLYDIDSVYNEYVSTGVLPWFPDSIKVALRR
ncbi:membrane lipoprotein lipid attachment site-containing protein [Labilibaculum filiforme]|nr:membrane lipoprotein lipid attachment site-containing protein [Labilibaculum filiforme]